VKPLEHPTTAHFQGFAFCSKSGSFSYLKKDLDMLQCGIIKSFSVNIA